MAIKHFCDLCNLELKEHNNINQVKLIQPRDYASDDPYIRDFKEVCDICFGKFESLLKVIQTKL